MDNRPIGIFDSGVGGLSAVRALTAAAPGESVVYLGDTARAPYGDRAPDAIKLLSRRNARFLRTKDIKALIVACNTSTANALAELTADNADIPVAGTIAPTAALAARETAGGRIGVLATSAVVRSGSYERALRALLPDARLVVEECPLLVPLIEAGHTDEDDEALDGPLILYLTPLLEARVDTIVLGCTHYPLIREAITKRAGPEVRLIDSGAACVGTVLEALGRRGALADPSAARTEVYYCTGRPETFTAVARRFLGRPVEARQVELEDRRYASSQKKQPQKRFISGKTGPRFPGT